MNDTVIAQYGAAVNILNLSSRQELTSSSVIRLNMFAPRKDQIVNMRILFNEIEVYNGLPITEFSYDKSLLKDTDYTLKVEITTGNGLTDYTTKRVVCR